MRSYIFIGLLAILIFAAAPILAACESNTVIPTAATTTPKTTTASVSTATPPATTTKTTTPSVSTVITPTTTTPQTPTTAPGMDHYSGAGISFDYPEEWYKVGFTWEPGYEWGTCLSGGVGNEPGVFVLRYDPGNKTLEEFTLETKDIGYGADFTISEPVAKTINGRSAYLYTYSGNKFGSLVQGDTLIITNGVSIWWVDCFALKTEYNQNKAGFETVFNTFIIE